MVKELDLFESNHGCGLNGCPGSHPERRCNTTYTGPELARNVLPRPFEARRPITHRFSIFEYFDLTGLLKYYCRAA
jgi:hypothetical protein